MLPNLGLPSSPAPGDPRHWPQGITFPQAWVAIARESDPRVIALRNRSSATAQILSSFTSVYGKPIECSLLIWRADAPARWRRDLRPLIAFRNGVAIATVLHGRAASVNGYSGGSPNFSDVFDLHPATIGGMGHMVLQSPAYLDVTGPTQQRILTPSPYVSRHTSPFWYDHYLFDAIGTVWRRRFGQAPRHARYADRLFRSLEVAYQACGVSARNEASLTDYGTQIALWVSAIEILAWPAQKHASRESVLKMLADPALGPKATRRRFRVALKGKKKTEWRLVSGLQRACLAMYAARNDFLHGNPVGPSTLALKRGGVSAPLPRIAALVYRAALVAYLDSIYAKQWTTLADFDTRFLETLQDESYDKALDEVFGVAP